MLRFVTILALAAVTMFAGDLDGSYTGTMTPEGRDASSALVVFKTVDGKLTGTGGPNEGEQHPFSNIKLEGDRLTFELVNPNGGVMKFDLKVDGNKLAGKIVRERSDGQTQTAMLAVERKK